MNCTSCFYNLLSKKEQSQKTQKYSLFSSKKSEYTLIPLEDKEYKFVLKNYESISFPWISTKAYKLNKAFTNKKITILHIKNANSKRTIILSHSIKDNLGTLYPFLIQLSSMMRCDLISYEYTPILKNEMISIEENVQTDLENVIDFSVQHFSLSINSIVLMSLSSGSIPTIAVASSETYQSISGIIMINPRAFLTYQQESAIPLFNEVDNEYNSSFQAMKISCNVFIIHGEKNTKISIEQSKQLCLNIKKAMTYFPTNGTQSNLFTQYRGKIFKKINYFLDILNKDIHIKKCATCSVLNTDLDSTKMSELDITRMSTINKVQQINKINSDLEVIPSYIGKSFKGESEYNDIEGDFIM